MTNTTNTIEVRVERRIPARCDEVYDAWINPKVPGNPWNAAETCTLDARVGGLFYWTLKGTAHYGRFTTMDRPNRLQHTWMSRNTLGEESMVTVTFQPRSDGTLMTLVHSGLPDTERARGHEGGWNYFLALLADQFGSGGRGKYHWEQAHPPANT
jgi:uncharacterized protein YndB with AHSA1/START domain